MAQLVRHSLNLNFVRNVKIRRKLNEIEDLVRANSTGSFGQPQVVPLPDDFDPDMPRVIFTSQAGYTQLLVSQMAMTLNVNYSEDWAIDFDRCRAYLLSKVPFLFELAELGWPGQRPIFCGVSTACRIAVESEKQAIGMVAPDFTEADYLLQRANELSYRWSLDAEGKFYVNTSVGCVVQLNEDVSPVVDMIPRFNAETIQGYAVDVTVDYNDRLAFNFSKEYSSSADTVLEMVSAGLDEARKAVETIKARCENAK